MKGVASIWSRGVARGLSALGVVGVACWTLTTGTACTGETVVAPPPKPTRPPLPKTFQLSELPASGFPDYRSTGSQLVRLDLEPARWNLRGITIPPKAAAVTNEFVLEHKEMPNPKNMPRVLKVISAPLPFPVETDEETFKPEGMEVFVSDAVVPFSRETAPQAKAASWRLSANGKQLILAYPEIPPAGAVRVQWDRAKQAIERHDPNKAADEQAFVRTSVTLEGQTRHGLLFVAPSLAEWVITVPENQPTFEGWLTLEAPPLDRPKSDGASVVLSISESGQTTEVDRQELAEPGQFTPWNVDLTRWAGKTVTLRVESEPGANPIFDWVFLGAPIVSGKSVSEVRRVIVVAMDTTRPDHLSFYGYDRPTPEIDAFAASGVAFDQAYSTAPRTRPSFRSSTTGRLPLSAVNATNIAAVFQRHDFATAGIVANVHLQPRFDFDDGYDWWWFDGKARANEQVDRALEWLHTNQERDAYLFVHFMDPHMSYDAPAEWRDKYVTNPDPKLPDKVKRSEVLRAMAQGELSDQTKAQLRALHDGEMGFMSHELGRFFDEVDRLPGRTLVVLHSDHGEEFWEHGGFEHNHSLYNELVHTVFVLRPGKGLPEGRRIQDPVTLMDLAPTLYDLFGFEDGPEVDGRTLVAELAGQSSAPRALPVGYLQYSHERWGVVWEGKKYILHTGTGQEELYDLLADPGEKTDLSTTTDLAPWREKTASSHGLPVGPGFRLHFALDRKSGPVEITLPAPAKLADVLDPEAIVEHRANIEWGEVPRRMPIDIGVTELSPDKTKLKFVPGRDPRGIVYVLFDAPQDPAAVTAVRDGKPLTLTQRATDAPGSCLGPVCISAGTVVVPPVSEAVLMGLAPAPAAEDDKLKLCLLGYLDQESDECKDLMNLSGGSDDDKGAEPPAGAGDDH